MIQTNNERLNVDVVLIDNFDSFTYNLVNQITPMVNQVTVYRNNVSIDYLRTKLDSNDTPTVILISPGPGNPDDAGITLELINMVQDKFPVLGICLGHQSIVQSFGGVVGLANNVMHGKTSNIELSQDEPRLFNHLNSPFRVARYHSLAATKIPEELITIAQVDGEIMAVKHVSKKILGYQFHPESILTTAGDRLMKNSLSWLMGE